MEYSPLDIRKDYRTEDGKWATVTEDGISYWRNTEHNLVFRQGSGFIIGIHGFDSILRLLNCHVKALEKALETSPDIQVCEQQEFNNEG